MSRYESRLQELVVSIPDLPAPTLTESVTCPSLAHMELFEFHCRVSFLGSLALAAVWLS
jgi:hypothetical protein